MIIEPNPVPSFRRACRQFGRSDVRRTGYLMGFLRACDLADQLFETDKPHRLGDEHHPTDLSSGRYIAHRGEY
jgi:hypothetical protein